jgi:hypothetical protein
VHAESASIPPHSLPSVARRKRMRMRTLSILLSMGIHVGLIAALGAVVWTTIAPLPGAGGSGLTGTKINLETAMASAAKSGSAPASSPRASDPGRSLVGSLEPVLAGGSDTPEPLQGLTSTSREAAPGGSGPETGPTLGASSLLGSLDAPSPGASAPASSGAASVTFGGLGAASVGSVVYVVDCSGPMVTSLPTVMSELKRSVDKLAPSQRFGVVVFRRLADDGPGAEAFAPLLVRATTNAKLLLHEWVDKIEPSGRSSPLAGLELALTLKPDAVFLLSRSIERSGGNVWESGLDATMAKLEQLNPVRTALLGTRRGVLIQTIQFLDEDPTGIMQAIGQKHGGGNGYRVVKRAQDLQAEPRASRTGSSTTIGAAAIDR